MRNETPNPDIIAVQLNSLSQEIYQQTRYLANLNRTYSPFAIESVNATSKMCQLACAAALPLVAKVIKDPKIKSIYDEIFEEMILHSYIYGIQREGIWIIDYQYQQFIERKPENQNPLSDCMVIFTSDLDTLRMQLHGHHVKPEVHKYWEVLFARINT